MAFTFFFRDEQPLTLGIENLIASTLGKSKIHILNAGCAMGMETYSFAILLAERVSKFTLRNINILAVDIDNENVDFGKTISNGRYRKDLLQLIPKELLTKYFQSDQDSDYYQIIDDLRNIITFKKHDLLTLKELRNDFSMVICKNVLLHFAPTQRVQVIESFKNMLLPGGILIMENTQNMPAELTQHFKRIYPYAQIYLKN